MKSANISKLKVICFTGLLTLSAQAAAQGARGDSGKGGKGGMMHKSMMGKMDADHMTSMIGQCMNEHGDSKVCEQQVLNKCEESKTAEECGKLMTDSKKKIEDNKKAK